MGNFNIIVGKCGEYSQSFKKTKHNYGLNRMSFTGEYYNLLDQKNRLSIPAKFRNSLNKRNKNNAKKHDV